jgi:hypothetical protein
MSVTNLPIGPGPFPGLQYEANEAGGVYHEDREVAGVMYRTYNAQYDGTEWSLVNSAEPAFAAAQDAEGSIHYFTMAAGSSPWTTWDGSPNNSVFNAVDYGMVAGDVGAAASNQAALQAAVNAVISAGGGRIFIPNGVYYISGPAVSITGTNVGIIIEGAAGGTQLAQQEGVPTFDVNGLSGGRGIRFRDLRISYASDLVFALPFAAVTTASCENVTCERVYFANCPGAFIDDSMSLQCGLLDCTIDYEASYNDQIMVSLSGSEDFIDHCVIRQTPVHSGGPTGCTGVQIGSASTIYVPNTHISDFDIGINIQGGGVNLLHALFSNVSCQSNVSAVIIQPATDSGQIYQVFFVNCVFARDQYATSVTPGVYIDTNGGPNANVSDIFFSNCMVHDWAGPGIQINAGQDIVISGGRFGQNATDATMTTSGAIAVTGAAARVSIIGANCSGKVPSYNSQPPATDQQPYGISVTGAVSDMEVRGCNLTNTKTGALYTPTTGIDLRVTESPGYNDQATAVLNGTPPAVPFTNISLGYYGPIQVNLWGAGVVSIELGSVATAFTAGSFALGHGARMTVAYAGSPRCLIVGQ